MASRPLRRIAAFAVGALFGTSLVVGVAPSPAGADSSCQLGRVCIWSQPDDQGQKATIPAQIGVCQNTPFPVESMKHRSIPRPVFLTFGAQGCSLLPLPGVVLPGQEVPDFPAPVQSVLGT